MTSALQLSPTPTSAAVGHGLALTHGFAPYYQDRYATIYHARCEMILPSLPTPELLLTDPPYPDYHEALYGYHANVLEPMRELPCRQLIFWTAKQDFPLDYTAIHIWDKKVGCGSEYERIYERNGETNYRMYRAYLINSTVAASYSGDDYTGHPSQKPIKLIRALIQRCKPKSVCDPYMGTGVVLLASKEAEIPCIGIEANERWCEIAARRLSQEYLPLAQNSRDQR
jgi:site-specific DNA-methyltransferase (adenine-specific)